MCDSTETKITYKAICERAKSVALEYMPDLPEKGTLEAWESFIVEVESLYSYEIASESCEWDWCIYYTRAMELCQAVPRDVLEQAESELEESGGAECVQPFGLYELACSLAFHIVQREIADAVEHAKEELIELAENQLENL